MASNSILDAALARWPLAIMRTGPVGWFVVTDLFRVRVSSFCFRAPDPGQSIWPDPRIVVSGAGTIPG
jgi:hypothetical protein